VQTIVTDRPGINVAAIAGALKDHGAPQQKGDASKAASLAADLGWVRRDPGPRGSWLHFPVHESSPTPTSPDPPPGLVPTHPDPPIGGVGGGVVKARPTPDPSRQADASVAAMAVSDTDSAAPRCASPVRPTTNERMPPAMRNRRIRRNRSLESRPRRHPRRPRHHPHRPHP
jgi:hypothetical protein